MPMWWWQVRSGFAASPTKVRVGVVLFFSFGKFAVVYLEIGTVAVGWVGQINHHSRIVGCSIAWIVWCSWLVVALVESISAKWCV
jgi:hypothetical protein